MKIAIDANVLVEWVTGDDLTIARLNALFATPDIVLIIPTPALAEFLVGADTVGYQWLNSMESKSRFQIAAFDRRAATECAVLETQARRHGNKKGGSKAAWQKVKVDRQVLAIAKLHGAAFLMTTDTQLSQLANSCGMATRIIDDLPLPESAMQRNLELDPPEES